MKTQRKQEKHCRKGEIAGEKKGKSNENPKKTRKTLPQGGNGMWEIGKKQ